MKINIRKGIFETNSSSAHAISLCDGTIKEKFYDLPIENNSLDYQFSDTEEKFGWGPCKTNSCMDKLDYLIATILLNSETIPEDIKRIEKIIKDFLGLQSCSISYPSNEDDYYDCINHQSVETGRDLISGPSECIIDFLFNSGSTLYISNDNGGMEDFIECIPWWSTKYENKFVNRNLTLELEYSEDTKEKIEFQGFPKYIGVDHIKRLFEKRWIRFDLDHKKFDRLGNSRLSFINESGDMIFVRQSKISWDNNDQYKSGNLKKSDYAIIKFKLYDNEYGRIL